MTTNAMDLINANKLQKERSGPKLHAKMMLTNSDRNRFNEYETETGQKEDQDLIFKATFDGPEPLDSPRIEEEKFS